MLYDINVKSIAGKPVGMSEFKNKVILIVNTASKCGFTPQFEGLEELHKKYESEGLEILGFPCNQFLFQDPKSNDEIMEFCKANYGVSFKMFEKIKVNGKNASPLYQFLTTESDGNTKKIKWNFTKFLINRDGEIVERFESTVKPADIEDKIVKLLR